MSIMKSGKTLVIKQNDVHLFDYFHSRRIGSFLNKNLQSIA